MKMDSKLERTAIKKRRESMNGGRKVHEARLVKILIAFGRLLFDPPSLSPEQFMFPL